MKTVIFKETPLSVEQLDNVSGGTCIETANDTRFLNSLNGSTDRFGVVKCALGGEELKSIVEDAWAKVGITANIYTGFSDNNYYYKGNKITQEQARQIAMDVTGHHMTTKDWKW